MDKEQVVKIAVCGAGGRIGYQVCKYLRQLCPNAEIQAVSRSRKGKIDELTGEDSKINWVQGDIDDTEFIDSLSKDNALIINAAGASGERGYNYAEVILKNCPLIEVGYNESFERQEGNKSENICIYGAGTAPGFTGILSRYLIEKTGDVKSRRLWYLVREALSFSAAQDMAGLFQTEEKGTRQGRNSSMKIKKEEHPIFKEPLYAVQYYDSENKKIDSIYNISDTQLYMLNDDDLLSLAESCGGDKELLRDKMIALSSIALDGRQEMIKIVCEVKGREEKTSVIQVESQSKLSGCTAACMAKCLLNKEYESCVYLASKVPFWKEVYDLMEKTEVFDVNEQYDLLISQSVDSESGEI